MPFAVVNRIVVDPLRGAEGCSAIGAPDKHHVAPGGEAGGLHARQHVNIVVGAGAGTVHRQEDLPNQSFRIYRIEVIYDAPQVDRSALVEGWYDGAVLCISRTNAPKLGLGSSDAAEKEVAVGVHIGRSPLGSVGNRDWIHPGEPAVDRTAEFVGGERAGIIPELVLESVTGASGFIYNEPLLVSSLRGSNVRKRLAA